MRNELLMSDEVYECAGCAGEVSVVEAVWLPEHLYYMDKSRPYCCLACFELHKPEPGYSEQTINISD